MLEAITEETFFNVNELSMSNMLDKYQQKKWAEGLKHKKSFQLLIFLEHGSLLPITGHLIVLG